MNDSCVYLAEKLVEDNRSAVLPDAASHEVDFWFRSAGGLLVSARGVVEVGDRKSVV